LKHLSLFTGVGGFDLGFEAAGMTTVGQVEIDRKCGEVLAAHWPDVPRHDDVTTAKEWIDSVGTIDIVSGGFPCQDVSVAGFRAGLAGERTGLFWDALALAQAAKARWIVLENVPGLLSSNEGRDFGTVISALADAGYGHVEWRVLDSQFFGVPQRRRRVFIVGCAGTPRGGSVLVESESGSGYLEEDEATREETTDAAKHSPIAFGHTQGLDIQASHIAAPTIRKNGSGGAVLTGKQVRRLTPRECERLQGFPDDWTSVLNDSERYKQMGNAVTVPVAEWVGRMINA
jgi:DNA (cytosine-5)-methyltransferase 1